jgi:hypothetical protein
VTRADPIVGPGRAPVRWLELLFGGIAAYETTIFGTPPSPAPFVAKGHWLVRQGALGGLVGRRLARGESIPGLTMRRLVAMSAMRLSGPAARRLLPSRAAAVLVNRWGTRLRAFYLGEGDEPFCVKLMVKGSRKAERAPGEIAARRRIEAIGTISMPRLRRVDETETLIGIAEELVLGRRFSGRRDVGLFIGTGLPAFAATWAAYGRRLVPADRLVGAAAVGAALAGDPSHAWFAARLDAALRRNPQLGVSICHGDLLPSNLCITPAGLTIIDWECAREGAVVFDLLRLAGKLPGETALMKAVAACTAEAFGTPQSSFGDQAVCNIAWRIAERPPVGLDLLRRFRRQVEEDRWW